MGISVQETYQGSLLVLSTNTFALTYDAFNDSLSYSGLLRMHIEPDYMLPRSHCSRSKAWGLDLSISRLLEMTSCGWRKTNKEYINDHIISGGN